MGLKRRARPAGARERVEVLNVNAPGHKVRVDAAKYEDMKQALLQVLPGRGDGLTQSEMMHAVLPHLSAELFPGGSKSGWWVKCVQLDLEARGVVVRDRSAKPLRWSRAPYRD